MSKKGFIYILVLKLFVSTNITVAQTILCNKGAYFKVPTANSIAVIGVDSTVVFESASEIEIAGSIHIQGNLSSDNSSIDVQAAASTTIGGDVLIDNGSNLSIGIGSSVSIDGSFTIDNASSIISSGSINLLGNWINNSDAQIGDGDANYNDVNLTGTTQQTIGGSVETYFENITFDNASNFILTSNIRVDQNVNLTNGIIETGANTLHINNIELSALTGYSSSNYFNGILRRNVTAGSSYDIPIGTATNYELIEFNLLTSAGLSYVDFNFTLDGSQTPPGALLVNNTAIDQFNDYGYWNVTPNGGTYAYNIKCSLTGHTDLGGTSDQYSLISDIGSGWSDYGTHSLSTQEYNASYIVAQRLNMQSGGNFIVGYSSNALYNQPTITNELLISGAILKIPTLVNMYSKGSNANLNIDNSGTLKTDSEYHIEGGWTNNGTASIANGDDTNTGKVIFEGNTTQSISGSTETQFEEFEINNSNGINITTSPRIDEKLILTDGFINTGSNWLYLFNSNSNPIESHSESSYINGTLRQAISASNSYPLPVGDGTEYQLATLDVNSATNLNYIDISFTQDGSQVPPGFLTVNGALVSEFLDYGYWSISPDDGYATYDLTVRSGGHSNGGETSDRYALITKIGSNWENYGIHSPSTQSFDGDYIIAKRTDLTSFGDYIVGKTISDSYTQPTITNQLNNFGSFIKLASSEQLYVLGTDAELNNDNSAAINIDNSAQLSVSGDLLNANSSVFEVNGWLNVSGNFQNNGSSSFLMAGGDAGTIEFNGTTNQEVSGSSISEFENLIVNNASNIKLEQDLITHETITFSAGLLNANGNTLTNTNTGNSISGFDENKYIVGNLRKYVTSGIYNLPLGTLSEYEFASVEFLDATDLAYVDVAFVENHSQTPSPTLTVNGALISEFLNYGYWSMSPDNPGSSEYNITIQSSGHTNGGVTADRYSVITDYSGAWENYGNHSASTQLVDGNKVLAVRSNLSEYGNYIIGKADEDSYVQPIITNELRNNNAYLKLSDSDILHVIGTDAELNIDDTAVFASANSTSIIVEGNVLIDRGATLQIDGSLGLAGDFTNNAIVSLNKPGGDAGTVMFNGSVQQNILGSSITEFENVTLNNPSGILQNTDVQVDENLIFTNGLFNTNGNLLTLTNTGSVFSGYDETKYIVGNIRKNVVVGVYDIPLGTIDNYELATIEFTDVTGLSYIDVSFTQDNSQTPPATLTVSGAWVPEFLNYGYWTVSPDNAGSSQYDITIQSSGHSNGGGTADKYSVITKYAADWIDYGVHSSSTQQINGDYILAKRSELSEYGQYIIGKADEDTYVQPAITNELRNNGTYFKLVESELLYVLGSDAELNNDNSATLTANNSTQISIEGGLLNDNSSTIELDGTLLLEGDFINNGTASLANVGGDLGTVVFNGAFQQEIGGSSVSWFENIALDNTLGFLLSQDIDIENLVSFTNGIINTDAYKISLLNIGNSITGFDENNYVAGNIRQYVTTGSYNLPLGTTDAYEFAQINFSDVTGLTYVDVSFIEDHAQLPPPTLTVDGAWIPEFLNYGYWAITPDNAGSSAYDISIQSSGHTNGGGTADLYSVLTDYAGTWEDYGTHSSSTQQINDELILAKRSNLNQYGNFIIGKADEDTYVQPPITNELQNNGAYIKVATATDLYAIGDNFELNNTNSGVIEILNSSLVSITGDINNTSSASIELDGSIALEGDWLNSGVASIVYGNATNIGSVEFNGSLEQNLDGSIITEFENLTINNTAGVTLNSVNQQIDGVLTFTNGLLNTESNLLIVNNVTNTSIIGYDETKYINGNLRRYVSDGLDYDFPMGTANFYELANIDLDVSTGLTYLDVEFTQDNSQTPPSGLEVDGAVINELLNYGYWTMTANAGMTAIDCDIICISSGHTNGLVDTDNLALISDIGSGWEDYGTHSTQSISGIYTSSQRLDITQLGSYIIGASNDPTYPQPTISDGLRIKGAYLKLTDNNPVKVSGPSAVLNNSSSAIISLSSVSELVVDGDLNNENTATISIDGKLSLSKDWTNDGVASLNLSTGTGQVEFNGLVEQNVSGSTVTNFEDLNINNANDVNLNGVDIEVSNLLSFTDGLINTNANKVIVYNAGASSVSGYDQTKYINGNLRQYVSTGTYELPVGTADYIELASLTINSATNLNYIDINYSANNENPVVGGTTVNGIDINEYLDYGYWSIVGESGFSSLLYDISLTNRGHTDAGSSADKYAILSQIPNTASWDDNGVHSSSTQIYDADYVTAVSSGLSDFGDYLIGKSLASLYYQPPITDELHNKGAFFKVTDSNPVVISGLDAKINNSANGNISVSNIANIIVDGDINNDATATISVDGTVSLSKNWTNNGTSSIDLGSGTGTVVFNGTINQEIIGSSLTEFQNVEINNVFNVDLNGVDAQVNNTLTFTNGLFNTDIQKLIVNNNSNSAIANYSADRYVNGNLRRYITSDTYDLPIGTNDNYELANISVNSATNLEYIDVSFTLSDENPTVGVTVQGIAISEFLDYGYWSIEGNPTCSAINYNLAITNTGHTDIGVTADKYAIVSKIPNTGSWDDNGIHSASTQEYAANSVLAKRMALSGFGDFIIGKSLAAIYYQPTITEELSIIGANLKVLNEINVQGTSAELNNQLAGNFQLESGASTTIEGDINNLTSSTIAIDGTISLTKNWTNNGSASISLGAGTGQVIFSGTSAQNISGNVITEFDNLEIDNSAGVTLNATDAIINEGLSFSDGLLNTGTQKIIVANNATGIITGYDENKYINGNLRRYVTTDVYELPIGNSNYYESLQLSIESATNLNYVDASFTVSDENPVTAGVQVNGIDINDYLDYGYWSVDGELGFSDLNYSIKLTNRGHTDLGSPADKYAVLSKIPNTNSWDDNGIHSTSTQIYDANYVTAERSNLNDFGDYIIGKGLATLFNQPTITENLHIKGANFKVTDSNPITISGLEADLNNSNNGLLTIETNGLVTVEGNVNILSTGTISLDGTLNLTKDWTNDGAADLSLGGGTGAIGFNGNIDQNISGSVITKFENLILNNANDLILNGVDAQVDNQLTLTDGMVLTGSQKLIVANTNTNAIASYTEDKYILGNLRRYLNTGNYDLPVGTDAYYQLATINISSQTGLSYLDVSFVESTESAPPGLKIDNISVISFLDYGYWSINSDGGESAVDYDITLRSGGHSNGGGISQYYTIAADLGNGWGEYGTHDNSTQSFDGTYIIAEKSSMNTFDPNFFGKFIIGKFGDYSQPTITEELRLKGVNLKVSEGDFRISGSDADINNESGTLTFNNTTDIVLEGDLNNESTFNTQANLEIQGDWINNMSISNSVGNITFAGSLSQTIGGSQESQFNELTINKLSNNVALASNIVVTSQLNLMMNDIVLGDYNLTLADGVTIVNPGDNSSYIQTNGAGVVVQEFVDPLPGQLTIPIGDENNNYSPVDFRLISGNLGAAASVSFSVTDLVHPQLETTTSYLTRYWTFDPTDISEPYSYNISLHYVDDDINGPEDELQFAKYSGMAWSYGGSVNTSSNTITLNGATTFSDGTGGKDVTPLPIELIDFTANYIPSKYQVLLRWITASEINNDYFTIEKSIDGINFEEIETIKGAGNSSSILNYSTADYQLDNYVMYYRLKQTDYDGKFEYSEVISVNLESNENHEYFVNLYPNPIQRGNKLYYSIEGLQSKEDIIVQITNINGSLVYYNTVKSDLVGQVFEQISVSEGLSSGVYILNARSDSQVINKLFIIVDDK